MSEWPPTWGDLIERAEGGVISRYQQRILSELMNGAHGFKDRSKGEQQILTSLIYEIDVYAGAASSRLQSSQFSDSVRRFVAPPPGAHKGPKFKKWKREHQDQKCIDACKLLREAVFDANWVGAVRAALTAGSYAHGHLAEVARPVLEHVTKKGSTRAPADSLVKRNCAIIEEARIIRTKNPTLAKNDNAVAEKLAKKHKNDPRYPSVRTIRLILASERKLAT
jgi:hypothetical protein